MNPRLELNMRRVAVGNLMDSIDQLDPCSRQRQPSALSMLQSRHDVRRLHRAVIVALSIAFAVVVLAAFA